MKSKRIIALALSTSMVLGSSMMAFATTTGSEGAGETATTNQNTVTGEGTAFEHVDKDIIDVTLPTVDSIGDVFDYYVDPEGLIKDAGTLADGTTNVTGNDDGVYFKNAGSGDAGTPAVDASVASYSITNGGSEVSTGLTVEIPTTTTATTLTYKTSLLDGSEGITTDGWYDESNTMVSGVSVKDPSNSDAEVTPSSGNTITVSAYQAAVSGNAGGYSSSSDEVKFEGKNSVDVNVSVKAEVKATAGGKDIALVENADALAAAKTPALLMKLKVGTDEKVITSAGVTASAKVEGVPNNFVVSTESGKFVYKIRPDENNGGTALDPWKSTSVQLIGKTNSADVPEGAGALTAPQIALTWSVAKHEAEAASTSYVNATEISASAKSFTLSLPEGVSVTSVVLGLNGTNTTLANNNHYTVSESSLTISKYASGWANGTITINYSDKHADTLACK